MTTTRPVTLQAIQTRFLGPTKMCAAGSLVQSWDYGKDGAENHVDAARALQARLGWTNWSLQTGCLPGGDMCHVQTA